MVIKWWYLGIGLMHLVGRHVILKINGDKDPLVKQAVKVFAENNRANQVAFCIGYGICMFVDVLAWPIVDAKFLVDGLLFLKKDKPAK